LVRDGVALKNPEVRPVQESKMAKMEREFRDGLVFELVPGVSRDLVELALSGLRIQVRR
jgi:hypothetical protein